MRTRDAVGEMKRVQVDDAKRRGGIAGTGFPGAALARPESAQRQHAGESERPPETGPGWRRTKVEFHFSPSRALESPQGASG